MYDLETSSRCAPTHYRVANEWLRKDEPILQWFAQPSRLGKDFIKHPTPSRKFRTRGHGQAETTVISVTKAPINLSEHMIADEQSLLETRFRAHAEKWERETAHLSSPTQMMRHPSYEAILLMGDAVVPCMIRDLAKNRRPWFGALTYLTGDNPIVRADAGRMDRMIAAWLNWGKAKGRI